MASRNLSLLRRPSCEKQPRLLNRVPLTGNNGHTSWSNNFAHNDFLAVGSLTSNNVRDVNLDECAWLTQPLGPVTPAPGPGHSERFYPLMGPGNKPVRRTGALHSSGSYLAIESTLPTVPRDLSTGNVSWAASDLDYANLALTSDVSLDVNLNFGDPYDFSDFGATSGIPSYAQSGGAADRASHVAGTVFGPTFPAAAANSPSESSASSQPSPPATHSQGTQGRRYQCPQSTCGGAFRHKKDLLRHLKSRKHATGLETVYGCRCGKEDARKDNHLRHVHSCMKPYSARAQYVCTCQLSTSIKEDHVNHVRCCRFGLGARGRPAAC
ncbi:hypothetical protein GGR57DRAFT_219683 [Xylariaceae sp. FL1272]|nr:hypothetical protein GGR57DRAFT_219683 [Xylariaceae sp. FL1272]